MEEREVRALLVQFLDESGVPWVYESGFVRFRVKREGMEWETDCRCVKGGLEIYGRWPFRASDRVEMQRACGEVNLRVNRGAAVLPRDGCPVFRSYAEMDDAYGAANRLRRAIEYSLRAAARYWGKMERAAAPCGENAHSLNHAAVKRPANDTHGGENARK